MKSLVVLVALLIASVHGGEVGCIKCSSNTNSADLLSEHTAVLESGANYRVWQCPGDSNFDRNCNWGNGDDPKSDAILVHGNYCSGSGTNDLQLDIANDVFLGGVVGGCSIKSQRILVQQDTYFSGTTDIQGDGPGPVALRFVETGELVMDTDNVVLELGGQLYFEPQTQLSVSGSGSRVIAAFDPDSPAEQEVIVFNDIDEDDVLEFDALHFIVKSGGTFRPRGNTMTDCKITLESGGTLELDGDLVFDHNGGASFNDPGVTEIVVESGASTTLASDANIGGTHRCHFINDGTLTLAADDPSNSEDFSVANTGVLLLKNSLDLSDEHDVPWSNDGSGAVTTLDDDSGCAVWNRPAHINDGMFGGLCFDFGDVEVRGTMMTHDPRVSTTTASNMTLSAPSVTFDSGGVLKVQLFEDLTLDRLDLDVGSVVVSSGFSVEIEAVNVTSLPADWEAVLVSNAHTNGSLPDFGDEASWEIGGRTLKLVESDGELKLAVLVTDDASAPFEVPGWLVVVLVMSGAVVVVFGGLVAARRVSNPTPAPLPKTTAAHALSKRRGRKEAKQVIAKDDTKQKLKAFKSLLLSAPSFAPAIGDVVAAGAREEIARSLVRAFEGDGKGHTLVGWISKAHVKSPDITGSDAFRSSTFAATVIGLYLRLVGEDYLVQVVSPTVSLVVLGRGGQKGKTELDESRMTMINPNKVQKGVTNISQTCSRLLKSLTSTPVPAALKEAMAVVRSTLTSGALKGRADAIIGQLFLTRFVLPAVSLPASYGIVATKPSAEATRTLLLTSKVFAAMLSGASLGGKEAFMGKMEGYRKKNTPRLKEWLKKLGSGVDFELSKKSAGKIVTDKDLQEESLLAALDHALRRGREIGEKLSGGTKTKWDELSGEETQNWARATMQSFASLNLSVASEESDWTVGDVETMAVGDFLVPDKRKKSGEGSPGKKRGGSPEKKKEAGSPAKKRGGSPEKKKGGPGNTRRPSASRSKARS